jgi:hypothetical protein
MEDNFMDKASKAIIDESIKIGNIVAKGSDHILVDYNAEQAESDPGDLIMNELCDILASGLQVDFFDNNGNFFSDSEENIRVRIGLD